MDSKDAPMLRWSTAALVMSGYWALSAVPHIGPIVLLPPFFAVVCTRGAEYLHATYPAYGVASRALTVAYLCFLPLTVISLGVLPAVTLLVCFIQIYTLLHRKEARNYYHLHLMALFLLLAACVQTPDPVIALVMLSFLVSGVWASLSLCYSAEETRADSAVAAEIVGLDNLSHQACHGKTEIGRGNMMMTAAVLSVVMVGSTVLFFLLTPRIEAGLLGRSQQVVESVGLSESVDLSSGSTIAKDTTPVMMIRFPDEPGGQVFNSDWLYWRVATLGRYVGNSWQRQKGGLYDPGIAPEPSNFSKRSPVEVQRTSRPKKKMVHQVIYLDDISEKSIPAMHLVQRIRIAEQTRGKRLRWGDDRDFSVVLDKTEDVRQLNYEVWSEPGSPSAEALRAAPDFEYDPEDRLSTVFLRNGLSEESIALVSQLVSDSENAYDKAMIIQSYLSGSEFLYTLSIPDMGSGSVIDSFINRTKRGHCELFATAMALMLRTQGVPTRVVRGYRGGEWREADATYTIRANMAHLWVEVWFPGQGWVIFDPSPRSNDASRTTLEMVSLFLSRAALKTKMFWFQEVLGFDRGAQIKRLRDFSFGLVRDIVGAKKEGAESGGGHRTPARGGSGFFSFLLILGLLGMVFWRLLRRSKGALTTEFTLNRDQVQVIRLYLALRRRLEKHGVDCKGKTAEEVRDTLTEGRWGAPDAAMDVLACYNTVRFGGVPLRSEQLVRLKRGLKELRPHEDS